MVSVIITKELINLKFYNMSYINLKNYFKIENILNFCKYKFKYMGNSQEQADKLVF